MRNIVHIAPTLPPAVNGLGDFCHILADNLEKMGYRHNSFLVRHKPPGVNRNVIPFEVNDFEQKLLKSGAEIVILHYVNYAYSRIGLPFYIVSALKAFKRKAGARIVVFFHELYASSNSMLKLPFYTSHLQKKLVRELCTTSDAVLTSCSIYVDRLEKLDPELKLDTVCTGIFSNIPDHLYNSCFQKEKGSLVVFGSLARRNGVYGSAGFSRMLDQLGISKIYDIGPGSIELSYHGVEVNVLGRLEREPIAHYLNKAWYGALNYVPGLLAKSGIFSAYTAFGVIPVNMREAQGPLNDGLVEGVNYFSFAGIENAVQDPWAARTAVLTWYRQRSQVVVSEKIEACIAGRVLAEVKIYQE